MTMKIHASRNKTPEQTAEINAVVKRRKARAKQRQKELHDTLFDLAVLLRKERLAQDMTQQNVAEGGGVRQQNIAAMELLKHRIYLDSIVAAFHGVGKRVVIFVVDDEDDVAS